MHTKHWLLCSEVVPLFRYVLSLCVTLPQGLLSILGREYVLGFH